MRERFRDNSSNSAHLLRCVRLQHTQVLGWKDCTPCTFTHTRHSTHSRDDKSSTFATASSASLPPSRDLEPLRPDSSSSLWEASCVNSSLSRRPSNAVARRCELRDGDAGGVVICPVLVPASFIEVLCNTRSQWHCSAPTPNKQASKPPNANNQHKQPLTLT